MSSRVLIVGCGYLGTALGTRLAAEGHLVWGLRREPGALPPTIQRVEADLCVPNTLRRLPDVDHVFFLASAAGVRAVSYFVGATQALRHKPRHMFFVTCVDVFGEREGRWVDEDSAVHPHSPPGEALLEVERHLRSQVQRATIVRLGQIYGPGRPAFVEPVLDGQALPSDAPTRWVSLVHRDDGAGALAHLMGLKRPGELYLVADREPVTVLDLCHWFAAELGQSPPHVDGSADSPVGVSSLRCMSERLVDSGYRFRYPTYRDGYRALIARLKR